MPNTIPGDPLKSLAQLGNFFEKRKQNKLKKEENDIREEGNNIAKEGNKTQEDRNDIYSKQNNLSNLRTNIDNMYSENSATAGHAVEEIFKTIDYYLEEYKDTGDLKYQNEAQSLLNKVCLYARNAGNSKGDNLHENDTCNTIAEQINTRFIAAQKNNHDWESLVIDLHGAFFTEKVSINKIRSVNNLKLNGCTFKKGLELELAHSNIDDEEERIIHNPFSITNCSFFGSLTIQGMLYSVAKEINIQNNNFNDKSCLNIIGLHALQGTRLPIKITGDSMPHNINFCTLSSASIEIETPNSYPSSKVSGNVLIEDCSEANFQTRNIHTIAGNLEIKRGPGHTGNTVGRISLQSCNVEGAIKIGSIADKIEKIQKIEIINSNIYNGFFINAGNIECIWFTYSKFLFEGKTLKSTTDTSFVRFVNSTAVTFYNISKIGRLYFHQVKFYPPVNIYSHKIDNFHVSTTNFYITKPSIKWNNDTDENNDYCINCLLVVFDNNTIAQNEHVIEIRKTDDGYELGA